MRLTKYEHSCVLVEDADARVLIDPGSFSRGFESLTGLTGVLVTHQHADHVDVDRLPALLAANPDAVLHAEAATVEVLAASGVPAVAVQPGDTLDLGTEVTVHGGLHEVIHPDYERVGNVGYLLGGRFLHPGDSLQVPNVAVEVLGLPTCAPWQKISETVDFLRAVHPTRAVPIHEALLAVPGTYYGHLDRLSPPDTELTVLEPGQTLQL